MSLTGSSSSHHLQESDMRKTLSVFFLTALLILPVFSQRMPANMLGQITEGESEYYIELQDNNRTLYQNDVAIKTWTEYINGNNRTITETDLETDVSVTSTYENSVLVSKKTVYEDSSYVQITYLYTEGSLLCTTKTDSEGNSVVEYYLRDPSDGSLIAVRRFENTELVGQSYLYAAENLYRNPGSSVITEGSFNVDDNGNISYERNGITYTYRQDGKILMEKEDSVTTEYSYDGNELIFITVSTEGPPSEKTVTKYSEGTAVSVTKTRGNEIIETADFSGENGAMVKTVYSSGKAVAKIYYMQDNKRVLKVEYY